MRRQKCWNYPSIKFRKRRGGGILRATTGEEYVGGGGGVLGTGATCLQ